MEYPNRFPDLDLLRFRNPNRFPTEFTSDTLVKAETLHVRRAGRETRVGTRTQDIMSQWTFSPMFGSRFSDGNCHMQMETVRPDVEALEK